MDEAPPPENRHANGMAIAALVSGMLSIALFPPACIAAIICGHIAYARIKKCPALPGKDQALIGLILGYLALIIAVAILLFAKLTPPAHPATFG